MEPREQPGTKAGTGSPCHPTAPPTVAPYALPVPEPLVGVEAPRSERDAASQPPHQPAPKVNFASKPIHYSQKSISFQMSIPNSLSRQKSDPQKTVRCALPSSICKKLFGAGKEGICPKVDRFVPHTQHVN